jgi:hypothetical protein
MSIHSLVNGAKSGYLLLLFIHFLLVPLSPGKRGRKREEICDGTYAEADGRGKSKIS